MDNKYDIAIIGAGIGGLVCGTYLAKAGLRVLIVEKNSSPGGYCRSFRKNKFNFDMCTHSLGSCRKDGEITRMLRDLGLSDRINLKRYVPSDIVITPEHKIHFLANTNATIQELQKNFPKDSGNIDKFFNVLINPAYLKLRNKTFSSLLDIFSSNELKGIIGFPLLGNVALPPSLISAFFSCLFYQEFMLDGGYYPEGGIQVLPNVLADRFKELGGDLLLSHKVTNINIENNKATGIAISEIGHISAKYVVSDCDAIQTFLKLVGRENLANETITELTKMQPSLSMFIIYLAIEESLKITFAEGANVWYLPHYDIDKLYFSAKNRIIDNLEEYMVRIVPGMKSLMIFMNAGFGDRILWNNYKEKMADIMMEKVENIIPDLSKQIIYKGVATPHALHNWTSNHKGAAYGWAAIPSQVMLPNFIKKTFIQNLYLSSHWNTLGHGIKGVVSSGALVAGLILNKIKN